MKKIYIFLAVILPVGVFAQPTIDQTWAPGVGDSYSLKSLDPSFAFPPAGGANVTWDYTSIIPGSSYLASYLDPSSTPYGSNFPSANLSLGDGSGTYVYYEANSSGFSEWGYQNSQTDATYSDPLLYIPFPITYGDNSSDNCSGTTFGGMGTRTGTGNYEGYGYGSLMLPGGTINNVLCVKYTYSLLDDFGGGVTQTSVNESYLFMSPNENYIILSISEYDFGSGPTKSGSVQTQFLGIEDGILNVNASLYPNPANSGTNSILNVTVPNTMEIGVRILDATGKVISDLGQQTLPSGSQNIELPTSDFSTGLYFVELSSEEGRVTKKLVVR